MTVILPPCFENHKCKWKTSHGACSLRHKNCQMNIVRARTDIDATVSIGSFTLFCDEPNGV